MSYSRRFHLQTIDGLKSKLFLITNKSTTKVTGQLLRDIDFSVLVNDTITLSVYDNKNKLIEFTYVLNTNSNVQYFSNDNVTLSIEFMYRQLNKTQHIIFCPMFELEFHGSSYFLSEY